MVTALDLEQFFQLQHSALLRLLLRRQRVWTRRIRCLTPMQHNQLRQSINSKPLVFHFCCKLKSNFISILRINQKAISIVLLANISAWFLGAFAVYFVKVYLYTAVLVANICLSVAIFVFHIMGNPRVNNCS